MLKWQSLTAISINLTDDLRAFLSRERKCYFKIMLRCAGILTDYGAEYVVGR